MKALERSAKNETVSMIITIVLYAAGAASVPYAWVSNFFGGAKELEWTLAFITKMLCSYLPIYLIFQFGFSDMFKLDWKKFKGSILAIPALLVAINNLPIVPLIMGDMSINGTFWQFLPYSLMCLSIGVLEEVTFRGCIFPLFLYRFEKTKKGQFWAIVCSSAVFGLMHLLNLLAGFSAGVFLQVGYSFLIGLICSFAMLASRNIYLPILMHSVYDVGGFVVSEGICDGVIWTTPNVVWTIVASLIFGAIIIVLYIKNDFSDINEKLNLLRIPEKIEKK